MRFGTFAIAVLAALVGCAPRLATPMAVNFARQATPIAAAQPTEVAIRLAPSRRKIQSVPGNWASIRITLSNATLLTAPMSVTVNQNAGSSVPAVFSALRPGAGYAVSVKLYSGADLGGYLIDRGSASGITLSAGANTVTIALAGAVFEGTVTTAFPWTFESPAGVVTDAAGNIYVSDGSCRIFKHGADGQVTVLAGSGACAGEDDDDKDDDDEACEGPGQSSPCDGTGSAARLINPRNLSVDAAGNLYFVDSGEAGCLVRKSTPGGTVSTILGAAGCGYSNATNFGGKFRRPEGVVYDPISTHFFVGDTGNHLIRKVTSAGQPSTVTGNQEGYRDATLPSQVKLDSPKGVAIDPTGATLYVADSDNSSIRKVNVATGETATLAGGNGTTANSAGFVDGSGTTARFRSPAGVTLGPDGNLYVADTGNHAVRKIILAPAAGQSVGDVLTLAGTGTAGCGTGQLTSPQQISLGQDGNLYIANTGCNSVAVLQ